MDFNRNQFLFMGMLVLLLGVQVRMVESYLLTPDATRFLAERSGNTSLASAAKSPGQYLAASSPAGAGLRKTVRPPEWIGWCLLSVGGVFVLHSLAMPKPGG